MLALVPRELAPETMLTDGQDTYTVEMRQADLARAVAVAVHRTHRIVYIERTGDYYYEDTARGVFSRLRERVLEQWCVGLLERVQNMGWGAQAVTEAKTLTRMFTKASMPDISRRYLLVSEGRYWDTEKCIWTEYPNEPCYYRLFDTDGPEGEVVALPPLTQELAERCQRKSNHTNQVLKNKGHLPMQFKFVSGWAVGNQDIYDDIMKTMAIPFMAKKPLGAGVWIGATRNGKSTAIDVLKSILGANNCTAVRLNQLDDPHHNTKLAFTLFNAPDEEDEKLDARIQATFKTLGAHGNLTLAKMYSEEGTHVNANFLNVFPMNHLPQWSGQGASACVKRSLIIPFYADFSAFDNRPGNFIEENLTPEVVADFVGTLTGIAKFYSDRELVFSPVMKQQQEMIQVHVDSALTYKREFELFFDGFQTKKMLYDDYLYWCQARGLEPRSKDAFFFMFQQYISAKPTKYTLPSGERVNVQRVRKKRKFCMVDKMRYAEVGTISYLHSDTKHCSLVERLDDYYSGKLGEDYKEKIIRRDVEGENEPIEDTPELEQTELLGASWE